jgi:hypothetical protein
MEHSDLLLTLPQVPHNLPCDYHPGTSLMSRGALHNKACLPCFFGCETFPVKYAWLKKTVSSVIYDTSRGADRPTLLPGNTITNFGADQDMRAAIRRWTKFAWMITDCSPDDRINPAPPGGSNPAGDTIIQTFFKSTQIADARPIWRM